MNHKLKFVLGRIENIVGKGENAGYQHFSPPMMFLKGFCFMFFETRDCLKKD